MKTHIFIPESSNVLLSLKDCEVLVAHPGQEGGTADGGRATPDEGHFSLVAPRELVEGGQGGISDLGDLHVLEHLEWVKGGG